MAEKIRAATQTQSVIGSRRPNCLVVDEIDGAMGGEDEGSSRGAIGVLVDVIKRAKALQSKRLRRLEAGGMDKGEGEDHDDNADEGKEKEKDGDGDGPERREGGIKGKGRHGKKGKSDSLSDLSRPIICICNDHFAPALRSLLPHVRLIQVEPVQKVRLVDRLRHICRQQRLLVDGRCLSALADMTECDVRSCLHTLQIIQDRGTTLASSSAVSRSFAGSGIGITTPLTVAHLQQMSVGQKDMAKSSAELWETVLCNKPPKLSLTVSDKGKSRLTINAVCLMSHRSQPMTHSLLYPSPCLRTLLSLCITKSTCSFVPGFNFAYTFCLFFHRTQRIRTHNAKVCSSRICSINNMVGHSESSE